MNSTEVIRTKQFNQAWQKLPPRLKKIVGRKIRELCRNERYPSLHVHRVVRQAKGTNLWICYISESLRLLYQRTDDQTIYLWDIGNHAIVDRLHTRQFPHPSALSAVS